MSWTIGLSLLALVALAVTAGLVLRASRQGEGRRALKIVVPPGVQESTFVRIGGIDQFISVRGEDQANPVLLVLHGGMATSYLALAPLFRAWERHFTVVQWDRRGVGKTYGRSGRAGSGEMTLDRIAEDGIELSEHLRRRLSKNKIVLLGHSMGSMIGITMAARRPDLFHAYVGTEQIVEMARNETVSYQMMLERVRAGGNRKAVRTLERIGQPPYGRLRDWGAKQQTAEIADPAYGRLAKGLMGRVVSSPHYSLKDILDFVGGQLFCGSKLYEQWMQFDARRLGSAYGTPIFVIQGKADVMTPTDLVEAWLSEVEAPRKELVLIEGGGHLVMLTAADAYLAALLAHVRPSVGEPSFTASDRRRTGGQ
jgi:pimeloyl-ACP methyl ester carboxylesterase